MFSISNWLTARELDLSHEEAKMFSTSSSTVSSNKNKYVNLSLLKPLDRGEVKEDYSKYLLIRIFQKAEAFFDSLSGETIKLSDGDKKYTRGSVINACFIRYFEMHGEPNSTQSHELNWEKDKEIYLAIVKEVNKHIKKNKLTQNLDEVAKLVYDKASKAMVRDRDISTLVKEINSSKITTFFLCLMGKAVKIEGKVYDKASLYRARFVKQLQTDHSYSTDGNHVLNWGQDKSRFLAAVQEVNNAIKSSLDLDSIIGTAKPVYAGL